MYILFRETHTQNRRNGARGGRAFARNLRLRKLLASPPPPPVERPEPPPETAHEASLLLDRHFPWLAGAFAPRRKNAATNLPLDSQHQGRFSTNDRGAT